MTAGHPKELLLQQYLNRSLNSVEAEGIRTHLEHCPDCRKSAEAYLKLEQLLRDRRELEPSPDFTDRLLARLEPQSVSAPGEVEAKNAVKHQRPGFWRPELANAMVATVATYLLLTSGIYKALLTLSPTLLKQGLATGTASISNWVGRLSQVLPF